MDQRENPFCSTLALEQNEHVANNLMAGGLAMCLLGGEAMVVDHVVLADHAAEALRRQHKKYSTQGYGLDPSAYPSPYGQNSGYKPNIPGYGNPSLSPIPGLSADRQTFVPPEWSPWGLLTAGVLTFMYAASLPDVVGSRTVVINED